MLICMHHQIKNLKHFLSLFISNNTISDFYIRNYIFVNYIIFMPLLLASCRSVEYPVIKKLNQMIMMIGQDTLASAVVEFHSFSKYPHLPD